MKKLQIPLRSQPGLILGSGAGVVLLLALLWFRLGSLTFGKAADIEYAANMRGGWSTLLSDPLSAPYYLVLNLVHLTGHTGVTSLRLVSTVFAVVAAILFYIVIRQWHSVRIAVIGTWLFASSAWFLHISRLGDPEILLLVGALIIVVLLTPNKKGRQTQLALPATLIGLALTLYIPGIIWLLTAGVLVRRKNIIEAWQASNKTLLRVVSVASALIVISPLIYGLARHTSLISQWLGFDLATLSVSRVSHNLLDVPRNLLLSSNFDAVHFLANLPLLSAFEIAMLIVGLYFYARNFKAARSRLIAVLAVVGWLVAGVSGNTAISLVLPVVYLLIASGIAYILHVWMKVFPHNPVARTAGITMILIAVALTSLYQTRSYFVAWRYNDETAQVFRNTL